VSHKGVDIVVRRDQDHRRVIRGTPGLPCRVEVVLLVRRRAIASPYWVEVRTIKALQHVRAKLIACLRELDGTILEGEGDVAQLVDQGVGTN